MIDFCWRCLLAQVVCFLFAIGQARADAGWSARFPAADGAGDSAAFAVGDGRYVVAVALSGMRAEVGRLRLDGRDLPAEVFVDPISRLVIFRMSGPPVTALRLREASTSLQGREFRAEGGTAKVTGMAKKVGGKILPLSLLRVDYSAAPPRPGTPLRDATGVVVAVAHQATGPQSGYALPAEVVRRALDSVQERGGIERGWLGLKLRPEAALPQVTQVQAGSPAAKAGVVPGDVLLEVGSRRVADYADAVNAFYFLRPGVGTTLRLRRGSRELQVGLTPAAREGG